MIQMRTECMLSISIINRKWRQIIAEIDFFINGDLCTYKELNISKLQYHLLKQKVRLYGREI